jgi:hypothetical protein
VVHCPAGERKHELAEEYLAKTNLTQGLFLILVGRAQAPVWDRAPGSARRPFLKFASEPLRQGARSQA